MPIAFVGFAAFECRCTALLACLSEPCRAPCAHCLVKNCGNSWIGLLRFGYALLFHIVK